MSKPFVTAVVVLTALVVGAPSGTARLLDSWPYDKLMKESDLVVIATATKTEETKDEPPDHHWSLEFVGQNTTFDVKHVFKGKTDGKPITVPHFKFGELKKGRDPKNFADNVIIDGPLFVAFHTKNAPDHLLFLKSIKDGRYEPVSGRIDPELSVRLLSAPAQELKKEK
jgi:hypothetical protein